MLTAVAILVVLAIKAVEVTLVACQRYHNQL